jgi:transcriptional regulator with XRE-family HTH domain
MHKISTRLKLLMAYLGVNQSEFATSLGVSQAQINRLLNDKSGVSDLFLTALAAKYGLTMHWVKTGEEPMFDERLRGLLAPSLPPNSGKPPKMVRLPLPPASENLAGLQPISVDNDRLAPRLCAGETAFVDRDPAALAELNGQVVAVETENGTVFAVLMIEGATVSLVFDLHDHDDFAPPGRLRIVGAVAKILRDP